MSKDQNQLLTRKFFEFMPAAIISAAIPSLNSVIDGVVASNFIEPGAMTSIGLFLPVNMFLLAISSMLIGGSIVMAGLSMGKGDIKHLNEIFSTDMIVLMLITFALGIACILGATPLARFLGASEVSLDNTVSYLRGIALGFPAIYGCGHLSQFLEMEQQHKRNYMALIVMMAANVTLDLLFVKEFGMGMFGLGLATLISNWIEFLIGAQYYVTSKAQIRFHIKDFKAATLPKICMVGFPVAAIQLYLTFRGYFMNHMLLRYAGDDGLAAISAQGTFQTLTYSVVYGIGTASRTLFSIFAGIGDRKSMTDVMQIALVKAMKRNILFCIVMAALAVPLTNIFFRDPSQPVYWYTVWLFVLYPCYMPFAAFGLTYSGYYQCMNKMKIANVISFIDGGAGLIAWAIFLVPLFGAYGMWASYVGCGLLELLAVLVYVTIKKKRFPKNFDDMMTFDDSFGVHDEDRLDIIVRSMDDVVETSDRVQKFCDDHAIDHKRGYYAALCLEEMAGNIVEHGFGDGKDHEVNMRLSYKNDELTIKLTDDCKPFNPKQRQEMVVSEDKVSNIGINLVSKIAKRMDYQAMIGWNVTTIEI